MPPQALDPQAVALARAIRQTESGGNFNARGKSGEFGAYQFMPTTWAATASKFGVTTPLERATPDEQNKVAYMQIKEWKDKGWNVGEIASAWNAGPGRKDAYLTGNAGVNEYGASYDTAAYAKKVADIYQSSKGVSTPSYANASTPQEVASPEQRTLGGFAQNVLESGAGLLAGVGEAILHPIQTIQNVGAVAVGGLQTVAGQETENTQKFDGLVNFFKDRYGSMDAFERTLYEDPVGFAADVSTVFGGAGLAAKGGSLAAKSAKLSGASETLSNVGNVLNKASDYTNPLAPIAAGAGKAINAGMDAGAGSVGKLAGLEPATIAAIRATPDAFTPQQIASVTREVVGDEVKTALDAKTNARDAAMSAYKPIRASTSEFDVEYDFLDKSFREVAKVDVVDGKVAPNSSSLVRTGPEIAKLQNIYNLYKPDFLAGKMTAPKFLNLRNDLYDVAYNDIGKKSGKVAEATDALAARLNQKYRDKISGLKEIDETFSKEQSEFREIRKRLITKDGKLTDNFYSVVANAANPSNAAQLERLEKLSPGITSKLKVLKAIEDIQKSMGNKVGVYGRPIAEVGGLVGGLATGQVSVVAIGIAAGIISEPANAVKLIRAAEAIDPKIVPMVLARLARYATISSTISEATKDPLSLGPQEDIGTESVEPMLGESPISTANIEAGLAPESQMPPTNRALEDLAKTHNFDLSGAREAGYSDEEILAFLNTAGV